MTPFKSMDVFQYMSLDDIKNWYKIIHRCWRRMFWLFLRLKYWTSIYLHRRSLIFIFLSQLFISNSSKQSIKMVLINFFFFFLIKNHWLEPKIGIEPSKTDFDLVWNWQAIKLIQLQFDFRIDEVWFRFQFEQNQLDLFGWDEMKLTYPYRFRI